MPRNPAVEAVLFLLRIYKLAISPYFRGACRFLPSCSDYAAEAFVIHGFWRGAWLTVARLSSCHPMGREGFDPVPRAGGFTGVQPGRRQTQSAISAK